MPGRHQSRFEDFEDSDNTNAYPKDPAKLRSRIMYIEGKADSLDSPGRIGRVSLINRGKPSTTAGNVSKVCAALAGKQISSILIAANTTGFQGLERMATTVYMVEIKESIDEDCAEEYWQDLCR